METLKVEVQDMVLQQVISESVDRYLAKILPDGLMERIKARNETGKLPILNNEQRLAYALRIWRNNGWLDRNHDPIQIERHKRDERRIKVHQLIDAINTSAREAKEVLGKDKSLLADFQQPTDASILLPQVITTVVREAVEPLMVLTSMMRRIQFSGEAITFPAVGAFTAEDMAPTQEYPERALEFGGQVVAKIGKVGVAVRFTDEMLRYSLWDVMTMHLQAAGRAMARHKEKKAANLITSEGTAIFDNSGGASTRGFTTGRDANGDGNGSLSLQDLFQMFADLLNAGFVPNTLLMNPMGWLIFAQNETLRSFGFANGGPLWGAIQGMPGVAPAFGGNGGVNLYKANAPAVNNSPAAMPNATLMSPVPSLFPAPLSIVVSPFIGFDQANQATDIIMCDRNELGVLIEDEPLVTEQFDDPSRDMTKVKMRERYAFALDNEGHSVATALGVRIRKGYDWEDFEIQREYPATGLPPITGGF